MKLLAPTLSRCAGFTLLELLVVVAIMAIATAGATLALRDSSVTALEREADRLSVMLEAGRAQSRATGLAVRWQSTAQGFAFLSGETGQTAKTVPWLSPEIRALQTAALVLGPEPIIAAQSVTLSLQDRKLTVATDGLRPFVVSSANAPASNTPR